MQAKTESIFLPGAYSLLVQGNPPGPSFYYAINLQIDLGSRPEKISDSSLDTNAVQIVLKIIFVDRFMYNKLMLV